MPITSDFSNLDTNSSNKKANLTEISQAKSMLVSDISAAKREKMLMPATDAINQLHQVTQEAIRKESISTYNPPSINEPLPAALVRGGYEALLGVPLTAAGLIAGGAAIAESEFGKGGMATDLKQFAVKQYLNFEQGMSKNAQPEDSFTYSYDQAKKGNLAALVAWSSHGLGYVSTQLATILTGAGVIEKGVELTGKKAVGKLLGTLVKREAERIAKTTGTSVMAEEILKQATSKITKKMGQHLGMASVGFGMEGGEIFGTLAKDSTERNKPLSSEEITKGLVGTGIAGAIEYMETILGLKAIKGKLGKLPGKGAAKKISGLKGRAVRAGITGAKIAPAESVQEYTQTGVEQWATGQNFSTEKAKRERIDAAALGALMMGPGMIGASLHGSTKEENIKNIKKATNTVINAESQLNFVDKVKEAVKTQDVEKYADMENTEYSPVIAVEALKAINKEESVSPQDKNSNYNKAVQIYQKLNKRAIEVLDKAEAAKDSDTIEQANAISDGLLKLQKKLLPLIKAMGKSGTTSPELQQALIEAKNTLEVNTALSNIFGSSSGGQDLNNFIDVESIINNPEIDSKAKLIVNNIQKLAESKELIEIQLAKTSEKSEDIFSLGKFHKGITEAISAIQTALTAKKEAAAKKELAELSEFAKKKQMQTTAFKHALSGKETVAGKKIIQQYNLENNTKELPNIATVKLMQLEATALTRAVSLGSTLIKNNRITPAVATAPTSKTPSTRSAQKVVTSEVEGTSEDKKKVVTSEVEGTSEDKKKVFSNLTKLGFIQTKSKSFFHKTNSMLSAMKAYVADTEIETDEKNLLNDIVYFTKKFSTGIKQVFKYKKNVKFHKEDPINWLTIDGALPQQIQEAIAAVSYKWLATRGQNTVFNSEDNIRGILGLDKEATLIPAAWEHITFLGNSTASLSETLGKEILKVIGIKADKLAAIQVEEQERLEKSLGFQALANLQNLGLIERITVSRKAFEQLVKATKRFDYNFKLTKKNFLAKSQESNIKFFKIKTDAKEIKPIPKVAKIIELFKNSKDTWQNVFVGEKDLTQYSWEPFPARKEKQERLRKSNQLATIEQTQNKNRNVNRPIQLAGQTMGIFSFFTSSFQQRIMGFKSSKNTYKNSIKSIEGKNRTLQRAYDQVQDWLYTAKKQKNKLQSSFYIPAYFGANCRMYQEGDIQLQNSKIHRYLFSYEDWTVTFDPTNSGLSDQFMEMVGQSLGIEVAKQGTLEIALKQTREALNTPVMKKALAAINELLLETDNSNIFDEDLIAEITENRPELMEPIVAGVEEGGENLHTLKGLIEYQKFQNAKQAGKALTTDLTFEIDGKANGVTISSLQLNQTKADPEQIGLFMSEGLSFTKDVKESDHFITYDPYESIAVTMGNVLNEIKTHFAQAIKTAKVKKIQKARIAKLQRLQIAESLFEPFFDEKGSIAPAIRKFAKNRSIGVLYGQGKKGVIRGLTNFFINNIIIDKLEYFAANPKEITEFIQFRQDINTLTKTNNFAQDIDTSTVLDSEALLEIKLETKMIKGLIRYLDEYHGDALNEAIDKIYGNIQNSRNYLNAAISAGVAYYNAAFSLEINEHFKKQDKITLLELNAIKEKIKDLFPKIATPLGGFIDIAEFERKLNYELPISEKNSKIEIAKIKKINERIRALQITQYYTKKDITRLTGRPHAIEGLKNPGVKPVVTIIHMLDSVVANKIIGNKQNIGVLNVHDGFLVSMLKAKKLNQIANKTLYNTMSTYNTAAAIRDSLIRTEKAFIKLGYKKSPEVTKTLKESFAKMQLTKKSPAKKAVKEIKLNVIDVKTNTIAAKKYILDSITAINQYFLAKGGFFTKNTPQIKIQSVLEQVEKKTIDAGNLINQTKTDNTVQGVLKEILGSSREPMSTDPTEYSVQKIIDEGNVVSTYEQIKNTSNIQDSPEHDAYLKKLLNQFARYVTNPLDLFLKTTTGEETKGQLEARDNKLFISSQVAGPVPVSGALATGIRMSTGEVYTHELVHVVTHYGLKVNGQLRKQVTVLYDIVKKALDYKAFLNDPTIDIYDPANFYEIQAAKARWNYIFRGGSVTERKYIDSATKMQYVSKISNHLDEFVALGATNENFNKAITGISLSKQKQKFFAKSTWAGFTGLNLQEFIIKVFSKIMELFHAKLNQALVKDNVGDELQRLITLLVKIDSKNKTRLYNTTKIADTAYNTLSSKADVFIKKIFKTVPVLNIGHGVKTSLKLAKKSNSVLGKALRNIEYKYQALDYGLIKSIQTEMKGNTVRVSKIHRLLHRRKTFLDASKSAITANVKKVATDIMKRELTAEEKVSLLKAGMKTDMSCLLDHMSISKITEVLESEKKNQREINIVLKKINQNSALSPFLIYYDQTSEALGYFLVHGRLRKGDHTFQSTYTIAALANTKFAETLTKEQIAIADSYVNQLASLYALQHTSKKHLNQMLDLIKEDPEGIYHFLRLHSELKNKALKDNFDNNPYQFIKGYTKEIFNPRIEYKLGTLDMEKVLSIQGFIRSEFPIDRDFLHDPTAEINIYSYVADTGRINDYQSQIASLTGEKNKGTDLYRIAKQIGQTQGEAVAENIAILKSKKKDISYMFTRHKVAATGGNFMIPLTDPSGTIIKYRYMMAESTKDAYLEKMNEYDTVLGAMAGQIIDKARTPIINEELIDSLLLMYKAEYNNNPAAYIQVSPYSSDPKLREIYYMLPDKTRNYIKEQWGSSKMWVAKDVLTIAFGYRKYSIVEAFAKTPVERHLIEKIIVKLTNMIFRSYGVKAINNAELAMTALTKLAKNNIIVKSLYVTLENFGSNLMYLRAKGISVRKILSVGWTAINQGLKYQADRQALDKAKLELKITTKTSEIKKLKIIILSLEDKIARNPVTKAMEAGLLPTLVDDVETDVTQDNFPGKTEQFITKTTNKLPPIVAKVGKILFLTQDTGAYKIMNNAVKMTDFVGRYILYQEYMKKAAALPNFDENESHVKAVMQVMEEFVNFDLPTHKTIEYFNQIGLIWFSKYTLRIQKIIMKGLINKPFTAGMSYLTSLSFGFDHIGNSLIGVTKNLLNNIGDPFHMFLDSVDELLPVAVLKSLFNR